MERKFVEKLEGLVKEAKQTQIGYAEKWLNEIRKYNKICIFGAGEHGRNWYQILKKYGIKADYFCDNDNSKWNQEVTDNVRCFSPKILQEQREDMAVVIAVRDYHELYQQAQDIMGGGNIYVATINKIGFMANFDYLKNEHKLDKIYQKMLQIIEVCEDDMSKEICCQSFRKWFIEEKTDILYNGEAYFFEKEIELSEKECMVDAGAFDGDTIRSFQKATGNQYEKIYAFELDKRNYKNLKNNCFGDEKKSEKNSRIKLYPFGLSDCKGTVHYNSNFETSQFQENGDETCEVDSLDNLLQDKKVTFIKMDIEGSEMRALKGAEKLIKCQRPKLAICIYHSVDDFLNIPLYIKYLNPDYNIMIRHHSDSEAETVCYAY